jgi:hypothetical protein
MSEKQHKSPEDRLKIRLRYNRRTNLKNFGGSFLVGIPVGILVGLSLSPVVGTLLSSILATVVGIATIAPENKKLFATRVKVASIMGLCWGLIMGIGGGIFERYNGLGISEKPKSAIDKWVEILYDRNDTFDYLSDSAIKYQSITCRKEKDSIALRHYIAWALFCAEFRKTNDEKNENNSSVQSQSSSDSARQNLFVYAPDYIYKPRGLDNSITPGDISQIRKEFGVHNGKIDGEMKTIRDICLFETVKEMKKHAEGCPYPAIKYIMSKYEMSASPNDVITDLQSYANILAHEKK